jgi:UBX domain-containing protein 1
MRSRVFCSRAPPSILNVNPGQPVELRVAKRTNEDYAPPQSHAKTFSGTGHRLGAPVPNVTGAGSGSETSAMPGSFPPSTQEDSRQPERITTRFEVDQTKPMTSIQLRLADGTR